MSRSASSVRVRVGGLLGDDALGLEGLFGAHDVVQIGRLRVHVPGGDGGLELDEGDAGRFVDGHLLDDVLDVLLADRDVVVDLREETGELVDGQVAGGVRVVPTENDRVGYLNVSR